MIIALAFGNHDLVSARELLQWVADLGKNPAHQLQLIADAGVQWSEVSRLIDLAADAFGKTECISNGQSVTGWPAGANSMFFAAAQHLQGKPFLWLEPDAIPLTRTWIDAIAAEHAACGKPFLGDIYRCEQSSLPATLLSGIAVYPPDAWERLRRLQPCCLRAWDVEMSPLILAQAASSKLIQHFWGEPGLPPVFAEAKPPHGPKNLLTPNFLRPGAALFHRNKDGSLIQVMRRRLGIPQKPETQAKSAIILVLPACAMDWRLAMSNIRWMGELNGHQKLGVDGVLSLDGGLPDEHVRMLAAAASDVFSSLEMFRYPKPKLPGWPQAPNWAFQHTAVRMAARQRPWFWLEADAVPVRPEWFTAIQSRYHREGKSFLGPIVKHMGHMNGVGVYPFDFPRRSPRAMSTVYAAWDFAMMPDMIGDCHDASDLIQHCWGIVGGQVHHREGPAAVFRNQQDVDRWLHPAAMIFHRCKDTSLQDRLRERYR